MERAKVSLLAVIAAALVARTALDLVPEARAATGSVSCEAFYVAPTSGMGVDTTLRKLVERHEPVRAWLEAHPGDVVYRSDGELDGYALVCVRAP